ncbi:hypothetical protein Acr_01g0013890 [Actinidia rufa]|uniref:Uncharacterized protein n=1 Tax=Actinidia rufa TaxID=165716 RepID=A0A7J0E590_9ERIC|nr:hypothetical protein Acr_01g0013890 [Actinidia rufa]
MTASTLKVGLNANLSPTRVPGWEKGEEEEEEEEVPQLMLNRRRNRVILEIEPEPEFSTIEFGKQVTIADSTKDHNTSLAFARAVMLPKDVADLVGEVSEEIRDLIVMQQIQGSEGQGCLRSRKALVVELYPGIYMEVWLACLAELDIPEDNPAWAKAAPTVEFPKPPEPYSPLILLSLNEEEYLNQPTEEDGKEAQASKATEPEGEASVDEAGKVATEAREAATKVGEAVV